MRDIDLFSGGAKGIGRVIGRSPTVNSPARASKANDTLFGGGEPFVRYID